MKHNIANQVEKFVICNNATTVTCHHAGKLMSALNIIHQAVTSELTGESTTEGMSDKKENKFEMWKVLFHRLIEDYRNGGINKGFSVLHAFLDCQHSQRGFQADVFATYILR